MTSLIVICLILAMVVLILAFVAFALKQQLKSMPKFEDNYDILICSELPLEDDPEEPTLYIQIREESPDIILEFNRYNGEMWNEFGRIKYADLVRLINDYVKNLQK